MMGRREQLIQAFTACGVAIVLGGALPGDSLSLRIALILGGVFVIMLMNASIED